jgi:hypothetical protein
LATTIFLFLPGSILSGLSVYFALSYLYIPIRICIPLAIVFSILIFGLTKYYSAAKESKSGEDTSSVDAKSQNRGIAKISFIVIYSIVLLLLTASSLNQSAELFVAWEKITPTQVLSLLAAIAFSFFLPGYALIMLLNRRRKLTFLLNLLLSYLISIFITGLAGYLSGSLGYAISDTKIFLIIVYILILFVFFIQEFTTLRKSSQVKLSTFYEWLTQFSRYLKINHPKLIVFISLFSLVILFTYYLNDGKIVVDQWFHHGRALLIGSKAFSALAPAESYKDLYDPRPSDVASINPPFFTSLLAVFFNLSGLPSVNAYVALNFLNIVPVVAFYYFFINWVPIDKRGAGLIAAAIFMLSSGFGWVYVFSQSVTSRPGGLLDSLEILSRAADKTYDIGRPTTFIDVGHPDITTPLIVIGLTAGFTLLGLIREVNMQSMNGSHGGLSVSQRFSGLSIPMAIMTIISFLGILAHDEFYFFIIIACTTIVVLYRFLHKLNSLSTFFASFVFAIFLVIFIDTFISPVKYYTSREILGIPLIYICLLYISGAWALYEDLRRNMISRIESTSIRGVKARIKQAILRRNVTLEFLNYRQNRFLKLSLGIVIVSIVAYTYVFMLLVWGQLSVDEVRSQIKDEWNVPWYLYPMKFGFTGLLGLAFILSCIFKKFEKVIFVFGIAGIITFFAGPYYDEHRCGKYVMSSMAAFAALLIFNIISSSVFRHKIKLRPLVIGIFLGGVVISISLSVILFAGYVESYSGISEWIEGGRRDFPTTSEMKLLNYLRKEVVDSKTYNIAMPEKEVDYSRGFITKIYGFSALPRVKLLQSPLTLNATTIESLYSLLEYSDTRFIILPKKDILIDAESRYPFADNNYNNNTSNLIRFIIENFPKRYEDNDYIMFEVPPLKPPSSKDSNVALIYQRDSELLPSVLNKTVALPFAYESFVLKKGDDNKTSMYADSIVKKIGSENKNIIRSVDIPTLGDNRNDTAGKGTILWSQPVQEIQQYRNRTDVFNNKTQINYIESNFRITELYNTKNKTGNETQEDLSAAGIFWKEKNSVYSVSIGKGGLELSQIPSKINLLSKQYRNEHSNNYYSNEDIHGMKGSSLTLSQNQEIKRQKGIWYNLKIVALKDRIEIYVDDIKRINLIRNNSSALLDEKNINDNSIPIVGIGSINSEIEFQPIIIGQVPDLSKQSLSSYQKEKIYHRQYYPVSSLALSNIKYDTFLDGDLSAFSKKYVVLPFDIPSNQKDDASRYFEFASRGGNLIVMNSDNNFEGIFTKLFSFNPGNLTKFSNILGSDAVNTSANTKGKKNNLNVSGTTWDVKPDFSPNMSMKSFYRDNDSINKNHKVAPFMIEKYYGKGKIIFVNTLGYFDSIFPKSFHSYKNIDNIKNQRFTDLSKLFPLIGVPENNDKGNKNKTTHPITGLPATRILGDLKISPQQTIIINSSSLLLPHSNNSNLSLDSYNLTAKEVSISSPLRIANLHKLSDNGFTDAVRDENHSILEKNQGQNPHYNYKLNKVIMKDLKIYGGPYEVIINSTNSSRSLYLPASTSYHDYVGISIPKGFDMTIRILDNNSSYAEFQLVTIDGGKNSSSKWIRVPGNNYSNNNFKNERSEIHFFDVRTDPKEIRDISLLMKRPNIKIINKEGQIASDGQNGQEMAALTFKRDSPKNSPLKIPIVLGTISSKVGYVDNYNQRNHGSINTQFVTYLDENLKITKNDGIVSTPAEYNKGRQFGIKFPGDISDYAKMHGVVIPWQEVLASPFNIVIALSIIALSGITLWLVWYRIMKINTR